MAIRLAHQIILFTLFKLLLNVGRRFVYPFAPALSRGLDVPLTAITAIIATGQISSLIGLFSGPLADRLGYRWMMRTGLAMLAAGMLLCGIVPVYWAVFLGLIIAGFGKILFDPAIQAYISIKTPYSSRARAIGIIETSWAGATLVGIPLLGLVIEYGGLQSSFYLLGLLGGAAWLVIGGVIPPDTPVTHRNASPKQGIAALVELAHYRPAAGMLAFGFWTNLANDNLFVIYGAWFETDFNLNIVSLGFTTAVIGMAELAGESMTAFFSDHFGLKRAILVGLVGLIAAYLLLPFFGESMVLAVVGIFFVFCAFEFTIVTSFPLSSELMAQNRATMMAGFYAAAGVGRMGGVLIGGPLWRSLGITGVAWVSAGLTLLGLLSVLWGLRDWKPAGTISN